MARMVETTPATRKLETLNETQRNQIKDALKDGLAGRKALMRAYESIMDRVKDSETKAMLRRFHEEEKQEYQKAEEICRRYNIDVGAVENIKAEVGAFLGKALLSGSKGAYGDMRDLLMLYGVECSGRAGAKPMKKVATMVGDTDWTNAIERSRERADSHIDYLEGRIDSLSGEAFGVPRT